MKKIGKIFPITINDSIILSFDQNWEEVCESPFSFNVLINKNGRLILEGPLVKSFRKKGVRT